MNWKGLRLLALLVPLALSARPAEAQQYTLWQSTWSIQSDDSDVSFASGGSPSIMRITSSSTGQKIVLIPFLLPSDVQANSFQVCYRVSNASTYIDGATLFEITTPGTASARIQETTNLASTSVTCYTSTATPFPDPYSPSGSMTLVLYLQFANTSHSIDIGGVGVNVEPAP